MSQKSDVITHYDIVIIGGGPAGLSAALYAARARLNTLVIEEKSQMGGQCSTTAELENYPGILQDSGSGLMEKFHQHAVHFGAKFQQGKVISLVLNNDGQDKVIKLKDGARIVSKVVIIATGTRPRTLGIPGEKEFAGRGVSYCATCDADFYTDLDIVVVGSGNTAIEEAVFLTRYVNQVTIIVIHDEGHLDADLIAKEQAMSNAKIRFIWNSVVTAIIGDELVQAVEIKNVKTGMIRVVETQGVFMFVGTVPQTDWLEPHKKQLPLTSAGYIKVNTQQETLLSGIFAVGDVCQKFLRQVVTAAGDGASAAVSASQYIEQEVFWTQHILQSEKCSLVLFWSPLQPESIALMTELESRVLDYAHWQLVPIDTYKNQRLANRYHICQLPTLVCLQRGKKTRRLEHPSESELSELFEESLND